MSCEDNVNYTAQAGRYRESWLSKIFEVKARGSNIQTELIGGLSTFLSLAYILVLNPAILSKGGFDADSVLFATAVASGAATILMGLWANLPFALAPGLEMNGFVAFSAIGLMGLTVSQSLTAIFLSGALCILMTWLPIRSRIINSIPVGLQANLATSVGVFVVTIGLFLSKIVVFHGGLPQELGELLSDEAQSLWLSLLATVFFRLFGQWLSKVKGAQFWGGLISGCAFLSAIVITSWFCHRIGIKPEMPAAASGSVVDDIGNLDWSVLVTPGFFTVFLVLFLIDFYGSIGKFIGLSAGTGLRSKESTVVGMEKAMYVDGIGTVGGALLGTTSIITYVESAIGIQAGARTGIAAVLCGLLMILSLLFSPLISLVPVVATSGVLVFVGYALLPREEWRTGSFTRFDIIVGVLMGIISFVTFSLDKAMLLGFGAYTFRHVFSRSTKTDPYLLGSFILLLLSFGVQLLLGK